MNIYIENASFFAENNIDPAKFVEFYINFHKHLLLAFKPQETDWSILTEILDIRKNMENQDANVSKMLEIMSESQTKLAEFNNLSTQAISKSVNDLSNIIRANSGNINTEMQLTLNNGLKNVESTMESIIRNWNIHNSTTNELIAEKISNVCNNKITEAVSSALLNHPKLTAMDSALKHLSDQFKSSQSKGEISQNMFVNLLSRDFPDAEIEDKSKEPHSGDIIFSRKDNRPVMIEIKNYTRAVPKPEIIKFQQDAENLKYHAILISINSGISKKKDFSFEITKDNLILFYIHNCGYSTEKFKLALNVIYMLADQLNLAKSERLEVSPQDILSLYNEYDSTINELKSVEDSMAANLRSIRSIKLESIKNILDKFNLNILKNKPVLHNVVQIPDNSFKCQKCDKSFPEEINLKRHISAKHRNPDDLDSDDSNVQTKKPKINS